MNSEDKELLKLFEPLRVADVRDGMDWMGYHHYGTLDYKIRPLYRTRAVGIAKTARYLPYEGPDPKVIGDEYTQWSNWYYGNVCIYPWFDEIEEGNFVVLDVSGVDVGLMGSENALGAKIKGARGFLTNGGGIRDTVLIVCRKRNTILFGLLIIYKITGKAHPHGNHIKLVFIFSAVDNCI